MEKEELDEFSIYEYQNKIYYRMNSPNQEDVVKKKKKKSLAIHAFRGTTW